MGRTHFTLNVPINVCNVDEAMTDGNSLYMYQ